LAVGQRVRVGDRASEWPEFVFVTARDGTGWVPARHLSASTGPAVVQTRYDTTELPTDLGEELEVVAEDLESGWLWCRASSGREGWVPVKTLELPGCRAGRGRMPIPKRRGGDPTMMAPSRSPIVTDRRSSSATLKAPSWFAAPWSRRLIGRVTWVSRSWG